MKILLTLIFSLFFSFFLSPLLAQNELLSSLKNREIDLEKEKLKEESSKLSTDWVERVFISYSDLRNRDSSPAQESRIFKISLSQPIFKSGGIYYGIKYASATKEVGLKLIEKKERELIKTLLSTTLNFKKIDLEIKKAKLLLENAKIDVERKEEHFLAGLIDGNILDNAIVDKNSAEMAILELEKSKENLLEVFSNLSDKKIEEIEPPKFELVEMDRFINKNIELAVAKDEIEQKRYKRAGIITTFLPTISLNAEYINQRVENPFRGSQAGKNEYSTVGLVFSMPLFDINIKNRIEISNIEYLQASLALNQKKEEERNLYKKSLNKLEIIKKKKEISEENIKKYSSLLKSTKDRVEAGESTIYDLSVMRNSKEQKELELEIFDIDRDLILLDIYAKIKS